MATGDQADFVGRIRAVLPARWFSLTAPPGLGVPVGQFDIGLSTLGSGAPVPSVTPVLDAVLNGLAYAWSWFSGLYSYVNLQSRIATATDVFLDIIASDYFGGAIFRKPAELDPHFSTRIRKEIVRLRNTRAGLVQALVDLTARVPVIFEPAMAFDTGGYGFQGMTAGTNLAYGGTGVVGAGGYGSLQLPFQFFITAFRASGGGIANVAGYYTGSGWAGGGYGSIAAFGADAGAIEYASLAMSLGQITDTDIDAAIVSVLPAAVTAWTRIESPSSAPSTGLLDSTFILDVSTLG